MCNTVLSSTTNGSVANKLDITNNHTIPPSMDTVKAAIKLGQNILPNETLFSFTSDITIRLVTIKIAAVVPSLIEILWEVK